MRWRAKHQYNGSRQKEVHASKSSTTGRSTCILVDFLIKMLVNEMLRNLIIISEVLPPGVTGPTTLLSGDETEQSKFEKKNPKINLTAVQVNGGQAADNSPVDAASVIFDFL